MSPRGAARARRGGNAHWVRLPGDRPEAFSSLLVTGAPSLHRAVSLARGLQDGPIPAALAGNSCEEIDDALRTSTARRERGYLLPGGPGERAMVERGDIAPMRWKPDPAGPVEAYVFVPTAAAYRP